ncbi:hypothetical protein [Nostoc commune]|nr:hypothetical protein [Nostoc commune]
MLPNTGKFVVRSLVKSSTVVTTRRLGKVVLDSVVLNTGIKF